LQEKFPPLCKGGGGGKTGVVENPSSCLSFGLGPQKLDATQLDNLHTEMAALFDGFPRSLGIYRRGHLSGNG